MTGAVAVTRLFPSVWSGGRRREQSSGAEPRASWKCVPKSALPIPLHHSVVLLQRHFQGHCHWYQVALDVDGGGRGA